MTHTAKHTPHSNIEGAGECPNCGADISPNDIDKPCWDCGGQAMNTAKHTPGPWIVGPGRVISTPSGEFYLTYGENKAGEPLFKSFVELDHNANLIAAAPVMYEALKAAYKLLREWTPSGEDNQGEVEGLIESALAQAEGR